MSVCVCVCVCVCERVCLCECVCVHPTLEHAVRSLANHWPIEYFLSCAVQDHLEVNASLRCGCMEGFVERRAWSVHRQEIVGMAQVFRVSGLIIIIIEGLSLLQSRVSGLEAGNVFSQAATVAFCAALVGRGAEINISDPAGSG